jgi:hypothetical protein
MRMPLYSADHQTVRLFASGWIQGRRLKEMLAQRVLGVFRATREGLELELPPRLLHRRCFLLLRGASVVEMI